MYRIYVLTGLFPLLNVLAVFAAMFTGIRLRLGLPLSILAGSLLLAAFFGHRECLFPYPASLAAWSRGLTRVFPESSMAAAVEPVVAGASSWRNASQHVAEYRPAVCVSPQPLCAAPHSSPGTMRGFSVSVFPTFSI